MVIPVLENDQYQLFMLGTVSRWTHTGTSDHYYDYEDHYHQWRGSGVVIEKKTGQLTQFNFFSPASRFGNPVPDLKHLVLGTTREIRDGVHSRQASVEEIALPGQENQVISFVCERLLDKVAKHADPIKAITIDYIPLAELVDAGIVTDGSGQIHLGLAVQTRGDL